MNVEYRLTDALAFQIFRTVSSPLQFRCHSESIEALYGTN